LLLLTKSRTKSANKSVPGCLTAPIIPLKFIQEKMDKVKEKDNSVTNVEKTKIIMTKIQIKTRMMMAWRVDNQWQVWEDKAKAKALHFIYLCF